MAFYVASNGRFLASHWVGKGKGLPGTRLIREIYGPNSYGTVYNIKPITPALTPPPPIPTVPTRIAPSATLANRTFSPSSSAPTPGAWKYDEHFNDPSLDKLAAARAVVFDMRGYPTDAGAGLLPHLLQAQPQAMPIALDADVKNSTYSERFEKAVPERFYEDLIAEQAMIGAAMGFAARGASGNR
jgi:hypothetical protein